MNQEMKRRIGSVLLWGCVVIPTTLGVYVESHRPELPRIQEVPNSEEILTAIVQAAMESRMIADEQGMILYASPTAAEMLGYKPADLRNKPSSILMADRFKQHHAEKFLAAMYRAVNNIPTADGRKQEDVVSRVRCNALTKEGQEKSLEVVTRIREIDGRHMAVVTLTPIESIKEEM